MIFVKSVVMIIVGVTPTVRLPTEGRRKCLKGMIRGFVQAILLIKDPFVTIWEQYLQYKMKQNKKLSSLDIYNLFFKQSLSMIWFQKSKREKGSIPAADTIDREFYDFTLRQALNFSDSWLNTNHVFGQMSEIFNNNTAFVVSYESLIFHYSDENAHASNIIIKKRYNKYEKLMNMLAFAHYDNLFKERLLCSYSFIDVMDKIDELTLMVSLFEKFQEDYNLICKLTHALRKRLGTNLRMHQIFDNFNC